MMQRPTVASTDAAGGWQRWVLGLLLRRLALATLVIALLAALASYAWQRAAIERQTVEIGRQAMAVLAGRVGALLSQPGLKPDAALQQALQPARTPTGDTGPQGARGWFQLVQLHDRNGRLLAERAAPLLQPGQHVAADTEQAARTALQSWPPTTPTDGLTEADTLRSGNELLVRCAIPLLDAGGDLIGLARGVHVVAADTVRELRARAWRDVAMVVALVAAVAALLYPVIRVLAQRLAGLSSELLSANLQTLAVVGSAIAKRDADTDAHNFRVCLYAARLGEAVGLGRDEMQGLIKGAFVHDVGKVGIRDAVLLKPGRLDADEFELMKTHVALGVDIVSRAAWLSDGLPVVAAHHEKFGGGGYPLGLQGAAIPRIARIFAIADVFDALTAERPYKEALRLDQAMVLLEQGRGAHFDPALLDTFATLAPSLYERYAAQPVETLRVALLELVGRHYTADISDISGSRRRARTPISR